MTVSQLPTLPPRAVLLCTVCDQAFSATPGDYFLLHPDTIMECPTCDEPLVAAIPRTGYDIVEPHMKLTCEMSKNCQKPVTHIGSKGYVYCTPCALERRASGYERTRKMTKAELAKVQSGTPIRYQRPS